MITNARLDKCRIFLYNKDMSKFRIIFILLIVLLMHAGCSMKRDKLVFVRTPSDVISAPSVTAKMPVEQRQAILDAIKTRNETVEKDPEWIRNAYSSLMVKRLNNISPKDYSGYTRYLDDGAAYVVVHPAFYPFFHTLGRLTPVIYDVNTAPDLPKLNVVEKFINLKPRNEEMAVLQAQERRMRDFVEFKSTQKKLLIIVVPRKYSKYNGYTYREGPDEYMRYLNEITNNAESVVFIESRNPNRGFPTEEDGVLLMDFLAALQAKKIYIAGGYVGRCLEDFYVSLTETYGNNDIFVIPELADISPQELNNRYAYDMLDENGRINLDIARMFIENDIFKVQQVHPAFKSLP